MGMLIIITVFDASEKGKKLNGKKQNKRMIMFL